MKNYNELARLFRILAHPARLCILTVLKKKECAVHEIQEILCCRQANVSQHLSILRKANLVTTRKIGKEVFYARNVEMLRKISDSKIIVNFCSPSRSHAN